MTNCIYCGVDVRSDRLHVMSGSVTDSVLACPKCAKKRGELDHHTYGTFIIGQMSLGLRKLGETLGAATPSMQVVTPSAAQETGDTSPEPKVKAKTKPKAKVEPEQVQEPEEKWEPRKKNGRVMIDHGPLENGYREEKLTPCPQTGMMLVDSGPWIFHDDDPDEETLAAEAEWEAEQIRKHEERKSAPAPEKASMQDILAEWDD